MMPRWANPSNLLTSLRLLLAPFVMAAIIERRPELGVALFFAAAITDGFDGLLARRFQWITRVGAFLDPIADKVLLSGVFLALAVIGTLPWWLVGIIFGRDLLILGSSGFALIFTHLRQFPPSVWGKAATFFQIVTAVSWLVRDASGAAWVESFAFVMIWPTAAVTVWSGIHYGWRGLRLVRTH